MNRPDWSLGALGLSLLAVAATAMLVGGLALVSNELRTPRIEKRLEEIIRTCQARADRTADPPGIDTFVDECEAEAKFRFNSQLFPLD